MKSQSHGNILPKVHLMGWKRSCGTLNFCSVARRSPWAKCLQYATSILWLRPRFGNG